MPTSEHKKSPQVLIGDLLVKAELVTLGQFADAMPISLKTGLPVGRVLIGSGYLSEEKFKAAVQAQSLIRDSLLHFDLAIKALRMVSERNISLENALNELGWRSEYYESTNRLGNLLVDSQCATRENVDDALDECFTSGLPLGRILVLRKVISEHVAYAALTAQVLIRERQIDREQAIDGLKLCARRKATIEETLDPDGMLRLKRAHVVRLGELLILAGQVQEIDLLSAVEQGLIDGQPIGQILVNSNLITATTLDQALTLQQMVTKRSLDPLQAAEILRKIRSTGMSLSQALANSSPQPQSSASGQTVELPEFLRLVGLVGQKDLIKAIDTSSTVGVPIEEVFQKLELVDAATIKTAKRCLQFLKDDSLKQDQAIFAMQSWIGSREDFDAILNKLGWGHV